ncbi:uncharacterized protein DS421_18g611000 [Arachis hypogaea]|nr:uncharacterized protein DS421_18g611000 [Arachis hypogaea]
MNVCTRVKMSRRLEMVRGRMMNGGRSSEVNCPIEMETAPGLFDAVNARNCLRSEQLERAHQEPHQFNEAAAVWDNSRQSLAAKSRVSSTALHGTIHAAPSIHRLRLGLLGYLITFALLAFVSQCQCWSSRVLSPLVFFPISMHFTTPLEILSAPTVLQLGSFHRLSRVEP